MASAALSKFTSDDPEDAMDPKKKTEKTAAEIEQIELQLALSKIWGSFDDATRAYFGPLDAAAKAAFVAKSAEERKADVAKAAKAAPSDDEVLYTDAEGNRYTKRSDPNTIALAKRADTAEATLKKERLEKRAKDELGHLAGTTSGKAALLEAVEKIVDPALREQALKALKSGEFALSKGFATFGTQEGDDEAEAGEGAPALAKLEKAVRKLAKDEKVTEAVAYDRVLQTSEGRALYEEAYPAGQVVN
jgi:hypothetical protein